MVQYFLIIDFIGIFLGRIILGFFLFYDARRYYKKQKALFWIYLTLGAFISTGYYSSIVLIILILTEALFLIYDLFFKKINFFLLEYRILRITVAVVLIFVGPGWLSLDRILNNRF